MNHFKLTIILTLFSIVANAQPFGGYLVSPQYDIRDSSNNVIGRTGRLEVDSLWAKFPSSKKNKSFTLEYYFKICDTLVQNQSFVDILLPSAGGYGMYIAGSGSNGQLQQSLYLSYFSTSGHKREGTTFNSDSVNCFDDNWHHLAFVYYDVWDWVDVYIDGYRVAHKICDKLNASYNEAKCGFDGTFGIDYYSFWSGGQVYIDEIKVSEGTKYFTLIANSRIFIPTYQKQTMDSATLAMWSFDDSQHATIFKDSGSYGLNLENKYSSFPTYYNNFMYVNEPHGIYINDSIKSDTTTICPFTYLDARGGKVYDWSPKYGLDAYNTPTPKVLISDTVITYTVVISDSFACDAHTDSITLNIKPYIPKATAFKDSFICERESYVQLKASGGVKYNWMPTTNLLNTSSDTPSVFSIKSQMYIVEIEDSIGCILNDSTFIDVFDRNVSLDYDSIQCKHSKYSIVFKFDSADLFAWSYTPDTIFGDSIAYFTADSNKKMVFTVKDTTLNCFHDDTAYIYSHYVNVSVKDTFIYNFPYMIRSKVEASTDTTTLYYEWNVTGIYGGGIGRDTLAISVPTDGLLTVTDIYGCKDRATVWIHGDTQTQQISGTVLLSDSITPLDSSLVIMIDRRASDTFLTVIDSTITDSQGNFTFNFNYSKSLTKTPHVFIKALPDSANFPQELPTYYDSSTLFIDSKKITINSHTPSINFYTKAGANPGGNGFIGGYVSNGAGKKAGGKPVKGLILLLVNSNAEIVDIETTDSTGYFKFAAIAVPEVYTLKVDRPLFFNENVPTISLTAQNKKYDSLDFYLYPDSLVLRGELVSVASITNVNSIRVYPNPFNESINILTNETISLVRLINNTGVVCYESNSIDNSLRYKINDLSKLPKGIYILEVTTKKGITRIKVVN